MSPLMYDPKKSIASTPPTTSTSNKQQQHHHHHSNQLYINALCLSCILGERGHEIVCRSCNKPLQSQPGFASLQIGTLYKFDLFAAFTCCSQRSACKRCHAHVSIDSPTSTTSGQDEPSQIVASPSFSSYSEERECRECKLRAFHFVKPLDEIFHPFTTTKSS